jgi:PP-loop family protein
MEDAVRSAGFTYVTLDLRGYRMGSQNEGLHIGS